MILFFPVESTNVYFQTIYAGVSGFTEHSGPRLAIAFSNSSHLVDYLEYEAKNCGFNLPSSEFCDSIIAELKQYSRTYAEKIVALALSKEVDERFPDFCPRLWIELDCIPIVLENLHRPRRNTDQGNLSTFSSWNAKSLGEQADSMMRKCVR